MQPVNMTWLVAYQSRLGPCLDARDGILSGDDLDALVVADGQQVLLVAGDDGWAQAATAAAIT